MRLQNRFLITFVPVLAVALFTLSALVYFQMVETSRAALHQDIKMAIERVGTRSQAIVDSIENDAVLLSDSAVIAQWFELSDEERQDSSSANNVLALFRKMKAAQPLYEEIRLLNRNGAEELRLASEEGPSERMSEAGTEWFNQVGLNWGASIHRSIRADVEDGSLSLTVARPVRIKHSAAAARATLFGYVVISARIEDIGEWIVESTIGHGGFVTLLDGTGTVVYAPTSHSLQSGEVASSLIASDRGAITARPVELLSTDSSSYSISVAPLFDGLSAVVAVPGSVVSDLAINIGKTVLLVTLAAIACFGLFFMGLVRTQVVNPIIRLQQNFVALGEGEVRAIADLDRNDELGELANSFKDMSAKLSRSMNDLRQSNDRIERLAYEDGLTGLPNRRRFLERISSTINRAQTHRLQVALLFVDLNDFKRLNDGEGHRAGDRLLREVAARLERCVLQWQETLDQSARKNYSSVARLGGDEFVVLLDDIKGSDEVTHFARAVFESLSKPVNLGDNERVISASAGIAIYPDHAKNPESLIASADAAMYEAKRGLGLGWRVYDQSMKDDIDERLALEADLSDALKRNQLKLHYQPQFNIGDGSVWGMEALLRWDHPTRGPVPPSEFIPVAEDTGLIVDIGHWVIDEACRQWAEWRAAGIAPERVSVNVSQRQFSLGDVAASVQSALDKHDMPATALEVEITESCIMDSKIDVVGILKQLRELGVHVAMDDFGTGHSSLGALTQLPIDTVKIDRCFISGITEEPVNDAIVAAVRMLATSMNLVVVAEGVEYELELERLQHHGCDVAQGYLLAKPLRPEDVAQVLGTHNRAA